MKTMFCSLAVVVSLLVSGCASMLTGISGADYQNAPLILAYSDEEVIRDQNKVATLIFLDTFGVAVDGVSVREYKGGFNPDLRISGSGKTSAYMVDVLPGTRTLTVSYDGITAGRNNPDMKPRTQIGSGTSVSASYSGPPLFSWERTSESTHTFQGGEIYCIGLKLLSVMGDVDLYPLEESERANVIAIRNNAVFPGQATVAGDGEQPAEAREQSVN